MSIDQPLEPFGDRDYTGFLKARACNPEEEIIRHQRLQMVRYMVGQLSTKYRHMIELRYYEELSYEEIATELNIPLGTVKAQLFRAKEMLFNLMQNKGGISYLDTTRRYD